jgi:hypothetical protein
MCLRKLLYLDESVRKFRRRHDDPLNPIARMHVQAELAKLAHGIDSKFP